MGKGINGINLMRTHIANIICVCYNVVRQKIGSIPFEHPLPVASIGAVTTRLYHNAASLGKMSGKH
jgi:hypothetical protein